MGEADAAVLKGNVERIGKLKIPLEIDFATAQEFEFSEEAIVPHPAAATARLRNPETAHGQGTRAVRGHLWEREKILECV